MRAEHDPQSQDILAALTLDHKSNTRRAGMSLLFHLMPAPKSMRKFGGSAYA